MRKKSQLFVGITTCFIVITAVNSDLSDAFVLTTNVNVLWPNATVPYYINPKHYNAQQIYFIMTSFTLFASKTCIKFLPMQTKLENFDQVLLLENPAGERQCTIGSESFNSFEKTRRLTLGYDCLMTPVIEMIIMRVLGLPLNDDVKSKNLNIIGSRTENQDLGPGYYVLSHLDYQNINLIYSSECQKRDYKNDQEFIEFCQNKPKSQRRKRDVNYVPINETETSYLFEYNNEDNIKKMEAAVQLMGLDKEFNKILELISKMVKKIFQNAKNMFCYKPILRTIEIELTRTKDPTKTSHEPNDKKGLRQNEEEEDSTKTIMHELSLWKTSGMNLIGSMAQYVMKNVSIVVNLLNFENPDPQNLNEQHFENLHLTTIHF